LPEQLLEIDSDDFQRLNEQLATVVVDPSDDLLQCFFGLH